MKVIFLDIDGVLNSDEYFDKIKNLNIESIESEVDIEKIKFLKKAVNETGSKVVLTSSWRYTRNAQKLKELLLKYNIYVGLTSFIQNERGLEIKKYLSEHQDVEDFVIVDDEIFDSYDEELMKKLVKISNGNGRNFGEGLLPKDVDEIIKRLGRNKLKNMDKRLYDESIILIGPSGAGKSTVAEELRKITNMPRLCLDRIANRARATGIRQRFKSADEFSYYMLSEVLKKAKNDNLYGIVDFGAGHSVYDNKDIFEKIKSMLRPFKNIVLLLPDKDEQKALNIMRERSTGDTKDNEKFFESPCNKELATMIIYGNNRQPIEIAEEIVSRIREKQEQQIK